MVLASSAQSWNLFFFGFVFCCGTAVGVGYIPALKCGWGYYPWVKGRVSGTVLCAFGFGAFIFSLLGTAIVNPDNVKPNVVVPFSDTVNYSYFGPEIANRVPYMYMVFLGVYICFTVLAFLCLNYPDAQTE